MKNKTYPSSTPAKKRRENYPEFTHYPPYIINNIHVSFSSNNISNETILKHFFFVLFRFDQKKLLFYFAFFRFIHSFVVKNKIFYT